MNIKAILESDFGIDLAFLSVCISTPALQTAV